MLWLTNTKRQKARKSLSAFRSLIATPQNLASVTTFVVPANGEFAISNANAVVTPGTLTVSVQGGRTIKTPALAANQIHRIGYLERGKRLTFVTPGSGLFKLYFVDSLGNYIPVAQGTI